MRPNLYFAFVLGTTIIFASVNSNCIISSDGEASSLDSINLHAQLITTADTQESDSFREITNQLKEKSELKSSSKNDISTSQRQLEQSSNVVAAPQEDKSPHQSEPVSSTKGSKTLSLAEIPQPTPWSRADWLQLLAILIAIPSGLYFACLQVIKTIKWQVNREVKESFDVLPWPIAPEEMMAKRSHKDSFYTGSADPNPSVYIGLELDAERPQVAGLIERIKKKRTKDWFHIAIYGDRKQGITIFMARLAYNLSQYKKLKVFGRKYHVLWCKEGETSFRRNLKERNTIDVHVLLEYRRYFVPRKLFIFQKKPLLVVIDNIFRPELLESSGIIEQGSIKILLRELMRRRINIITSSSSQDIAIEETDVLLKLKLERPDAECILSKLVQEGIISREFADAFPGGPNGERMYKKQLFAFLSSLLAESRSEAIFKTSFIKSFENHFATLSDQSKLALKIIAICQLVDIHLHESILKEAFPESFHACKVI